LGYFMTIRYILCSFGTFFPVLVSCSKKNLATLHSPAIVPMKFSRLEFSKKNPSNWHDKQICESRYIHMYHMLHSMYVIWGPSRYLERCKMILFYFLTMPLFLLFQHSNNAH
jgi:hypothetical protein